MANHDDLTAALRDWIEVFMHRSMGGFVCFAKAHGLSMSQMGALFHMSRRESTGVSDIGDNLGVTSAAASQMLDRLVQQGLIVRTEDPSDRRSKRIALTEKGQDFIHSITEARHRWFASLAGAMSTKERAVVIEGLRILIEKSAATESDTSWSEPQKGGVGA